MSSSVPTSIPAFIAIAQAALPEGFQIRQGAVFGPFIAAQSLQITGIRFTKDQHAELGPNYKHEEEYNILCSLVGTAGNDDTASRIQEVAALYADLSVAIANQPTLSGTVRTAWTTQTGYKLSPTSQGWSAAQVDFQVIVTARVPSES